MKIGPCGCRSDWKMKNAHESLHIAHIDIESLLAFVLHALNVLLFAKLERRRKICFYFKIINCSLLLCSEGKFEDF